MEPTNSSDLLQKFQAVTQGPDGDLLINLLDILYARITEKEYDDQYLSPDDLEALKRGQEDIKTGRCLSLEDYRNGKRL
jgi:hypothetical protein